MFENKISERVRSPPGDPRRPLEPRLRRQEVRGVSGSAEQHREEELRHVHVAGQQLWQAAAAKHPLLVTSRSYRGPSSEPPPTWPRVSRSRACNGNRICLLRSPRGGWRTAGRPAAAGGPSAKSRSRAAPIRDEASFWVPSRAAGGGTSGRRPGDAGPRLSAACDPYQRTPHAFFSSHAIITA